MKKIFLTATLALLITGCGSSAKKSDSGASGPNANKGANSGSNDDMPSDDSSPQDMKGLTTDAGTSTSLDPKYRPLAQAIRSGRSKAVTDQAANLLGKNAYDATALNALALLHLKRGHTGAAKLLINKALERNQNASLYNNLGVALMSEGDLTGALLNFKRALKSDAGNQAAAGNLGSLYMQGGDITRAMPLLETSYKSNPANLGIANNYAIALRSSGDLDGATRVYDSILKQDPKNVYALLNEAIILIDFQNKPKDGLTLVYKLKFLETDKKDVVNRANALEKKAKAGLQ
jgi:Flp pilus assembly protein TadD